MGGAAQDKKEAVAPTQSPPKFAPPPPKRPMEEVPAPEVVQGQLILRPAIIPIEEFRAAYEEA